MRHNVSYLVLALSLVACGQESREDSKETGRKDNSPTTGQTGTTDSTVQLVERTVTYKCGARWRVTKQDGSFTYSGKIEDCTAKVSVESDKETPPLVGQLRKCFALQPNAGLISDYWFETVFTPDGDNLVGSLSSASQRMHTIITTKPNYVEVPCDDSIWPESTIN